MLSFSLGGGDNEYQAQAEQAMNQARAKSGGGKSGGGHNGSIIAQVLDLLGINHQVAKGPKQGAPMETGDLASKAPTPDSQKVAIVDKSGDVVAQVNQAIKNSNAPQVQPIAMAPLTLSGDGLPNVIPMIDPNTGRPFGS